MLLHVDGYLCELKDAQIRGGLHTLGAAPAGETLVDLVLAITRLPHGQVPSLRGDGRGRARPRSRRRRSPSTRSRRGAGRSSKRAAARDWAPSADGSEPADAPLDLRVVGAEARRSRPTRSATSCTASTAGTSPPGRAARSPAAARTCCRRAGTSTRSIPKALPTELSWEVGCKLADDLLARHLEEEGTYPRTVGLVLWGTAVMRTQGDDVAEALALLGIRPVWESESRRVVGLEVIPLEELGRPRIDVTLRISGFFRDAFPNLVELLDDATRLAASLDEPPDRNYVRTEGAFDPRVYGPGPGAYGSGILQLLEQRTWRSDDDLAAVYIAWSGYAYGREGFGVPAEDAMKRRFAAIDVAVKNQDNREHDIFDSDDYLQEHGGMIATIRSLTGRDPKAWFGDSANPARPVVRSLAEEAARVVRTRVVNPRWIEAMQQHGYKGAFEMAATVDYLFGYDATAHVVDDWMYEKVTAAYVADPEVRKFFEQSNPWALRSIAERLLEAVERGMWDASGDAVQALRDAVLEAETWEETR